MESFKYLWKLCTQIVQKIKIKAKINARDKAVFLGLFKGFSYVTACSNVLYNLETRTEAQKQTTILTSFSDEFETFLSQKLSNIF